MIRLPAEPIAEAAIQEFQEQHPRARMIVQDADGVRYVGQDLWSNEMLQLVRKGIRLHAYNQPSGYSPVRVLSEEELKGQIPVLVDTLECSTEVQLDEADFERVVHAMPVRLIAKGQKQIGAFLHRLADEPPLQVMILDDSPLQDQHVKLLETMPWLTEINCTTRVYPSKLSSPSLGRSPPLKSSPTTEPSIAISTPDSLHVAFLQRMRRIASSVTGTPNRQQPIHRTPFFQPEKPYALAWPAC